MGRRITQRQLRNESGDVMRGLDAGERFVVTRRGVPIGELTPFAHRRYVGRDEALRAFARSAPIDAAAFRADVDRLLDQDATPRG